MLNNLLFVNDDVITNVTETMDLLRCEMRPQSPHPVVTVASKLSMGD